MAVEEGGRYGKIGGRGVMTPVSFFWGGGGCNILFLKNYYCSI